MKLGKVFITTFLKALHKAIEAGKSNWIESNHIRRKKWHAGLKLFQIQSGCDTKFRAINGYTPFILFLRLERRQLRKTVTRISL